MKKVKKSQNKSRGKHRGEMSADPGRLALRQAVRARTKVRLVRGKSKPSSERDTDVSKS